MKLEVVKENKLNETYTIPVDSKLHHKHDGTIKENDTIYTVTIFNNKGENGHDIIMSNADDAFDEVFFNTPEEAKSFADKNYPDAWNVVIREEDWYDETLGDTRTSGPFLKRENGKWFDPQADWKKDNLEEEFDPMKDARSNILEFPNGGDNIVLNVEYKDGKLIAGSATNAGIIPEFEIEYDKDFDLDWNLNVLYNVIVEEHPEYLEMKGMKESIKTRKSVRVREAQNVEDQVIVDIRKPGYLSKMDELRKQGYERLWSGDGKICFAKPKELKENRTLTEEVSSEAYEVANKMKIAFDKMDKVTWDDFDEQFALAIRDTFGIDNIWEQEDEFKLDTDTGKIDINDFENDIRGILGMNGYETELEGENEGGLKRITENKSLKEDYSDSDIRRAIFRVHDVMEDTYTQVVADITSRALDNDPEEDVYEAVNEAIDKGLIYYNDEWAVIEHYTTPKDIDSDTYYNAIQQLAEDVEEVVNYLLENGDSLTESRTTDILKNQSQNIEKPTTTGEAQSPAYADAARELDKAKEIKDKKVGADLDNVLNKKFDLDRAKKLTLDESLFN